MRVLAVTFLLALLIAPAAPAQGTTLEEAAQALQSNPVYVHPDADPKLTGQQADELRRRITDTDAGPMYVAVLPREVLNQAGGSMGEALTEMGRNVGRGGTYVLVAGNSIRAGSTEGAAPEGETASAMNEALDAQREDGLSAILLDFTDRMGEIKTGAAGATDGGGGGGGSWFPIALGILVLGGGAFAISRGRRQQKEQQQRFEEIHDQVRDDVVALGEEIRALDLDVQMPNTPPEATADYEAALGAYERASAAVDRARTPQDLEPVGAAVEEGRYAMASARARLAGQEPPERRAPCFFDPRHGPSSRDVMWSPPWGEPREVPACEADAQRVEAGAEPDPREVTVGGRRVPYWNAGPAYAPYMGGFFGGGLLPGIFIGSMLGGDMWGGGGGWTSGDSGGFGGGDSGWGGGDFGGGGFGGGDFGGGGGFGGGDF